MGGESGSGREQGGRGRAPPLREPPQVALGDRLTDLPDRTEARVQVVFGEEGLLGRDLLHRMRGADGTEAAALSDVGRTTRPVREEHAAVAGVLRVRGRVEQVAAE